MTGAIGLFKVTREAQREAEQEWGNSGVGGEIVNSGFHQDEAGFEMEVVPAMKLETS